MAATIRGPGPGDSSAGSKTIVPHTHCIVCCVDPRFGSSIAATPRWATQTSAPRVCVAPAAAPSDITRRKMRPLLVTSHSQWSRIVHRTLRIAEAGVLESWPAGRHARTYPPSRPGRPIAGLVCSRSWSYGTEGLPHAIYAGIQPTLDKSSPNPPLVPRAAQRVAVGLFPFPGQPM